MGKRGRRRNREKRKQQQLGGGLPMGQVQPDAQPQQGQGKKKGKKNKPPPVRHPLDAALDTLIGRMADIVPPRPADPPGVMVIDYAPPPEPPPAPPSAGPSRFELPLLANTKFSTCGECTVCCTVPAVEELGKPYYARCTHVVDKKGCSIYYARPHSCQGYFCGYRLGLLPPDPKFRPDNLGILFDVGAFNRTPDDHQLFLNVYEVWPDAFGRIRVELDGDPKAETPRGDYTAEQRQYGIRELVIDPRPAVQDCMTAIMMANQWLDGVRLCKYGNRQGVRFPINTTHYTDDGRYWDTWVQVPDQPSVWVNADPPAPELRGAALDNWDPA